MRLLNTRPSMLAILVISTQLLAAPAFADMPHKVSGKVVYVDDGDTIVVLVDGRTQVQVRLSSIDAPEVSHTTQETGRIGQPFSVQSGQYLGTLVKGKTVDMNCFEQDKYGRQVCEAFVAGESVNRAMVRAGMAWANQASKRRYLRDKTLLDLEAAARSTKVGLWADQAPIAPWEWRNSCWSHGLCR